jgi:hypothetical protein
MTMVLNLVVILKGWYSQNGWKTKLTLINQMDEIVTVRIKLFVGEGGNPIAVVKLKLPPKEIRFYDLRRVKRADGNSGVLLIESEKPIVCTSHLVNLEDEMKVIDYRLVPQDEMPACC